MKLLLFLYINYFLLLFSSHENTFADGIRNNWQLSKCNNDLIFFIASEKHKVFINTSLY